MLQLRIENCNAQNADLISDFLEGFGAVSVTMTDKFDNPILEPDLGTMPLWPNVIIEALFDEAHDLEEIQRDLLLIYPDLLCSVTTVLDEEWEKTCLNNFTSQIFANKLVVSPSWIECEVENTVNLTLDPGLAFGTGSHATTYLCLDWLANKDLSGKNVIDYGCGSGILGLAAIKLGAATVSAFDIDNQALIATKNNAEVNNISADTLNIVSDKNLLLKSDIIIANILLKTLIKLKEEFIGLLFKDGLLVVSGILVEQTKELIKEYEPDFTLVAAEFKDGWAVLVFKLGQGNSLNMPEQEDM
jgi:ribosomal protein L11 methyltransferase